MRFFKINATNCEYVFINCQKFLKIRIQYPLLVFITIWPLIHFSLKYIAISLSISLFFSLSVSLFPYPLSFSYLKIIISKEVGNKFHYKYHIETEPLFKKRIYRPPLLKWGKLLWVCPSVWLSVRLSFCLYVTILFTGWYRSTWRYSYE